MSNLLIAVIAAGWLACGIIAVGGDLAYVDGTWPSKTRRERQATLVKSWMLCPFGALSLFAIAALTGFEYGISFRKPRAEQEPKIPTD